MVINMAESEEKKEIAVLLEENRVFYPPEEIVKNSNVRK